MLERSRRREKGRTLSHQSVLGTIFHPSSLFNMLKPCLLVFAEDPLLEAFIKQMAETKRLDVYTAAQGEQLTQCVKTFSPVMLVADLTGLDTNWLHRHMADIKHQHPDFPIAAIVATDEEGLLRRLERAGCNVILKKSEVKDKLPDVVEGILNR